MSRISFNRKQGKLKQLLGIRAQLALLGVILMAPLMLDHTRSHRDTRGKQIVRKISCNSPVPLMSAIAQARLNPDQNQDLLSF